MSNDQQRSGKDSVPGTRCKAVPIAMATGLAEYTAGQQELPVRLTSLADMVQWAQNWSRSSLIFDGLSVDMPMLVKEKQDRRVVFAARN